jgi:hypothetical protein
MNEKISFIAKDGKEFNNKQSCIDYDDFYLDDDQLIKCFKFFYEIPENKGDISLANNPNDAIIYFFKFERCEKYQQIKLYYNYKSAGYGVCEQYTLKGFKIFKNLDFVVMFEEKDDRGSRVFCWESEKTYNIKAFYEEFNKIKSEVK